jgi:Tol biopolymer transport system component
MKANKKYFLIYLAIGLILGLCVFPFTFFVGWQLSRNLFTSVNNPESQSPKIDLTPTINLATQKITEEEGNIYNELIMVCTSSGESIFVQLDGKYFDSPNYCGTWSPDGQYVIMSDVDVLSGPDVLFRQRGSNEIIDITENLPVPGWISFFSWSPDSKYVSVAGWGYDETKNGIYLIDMNSGMPPQKSWQIFKTDETHGLGELAWSPNGEYIGVMGGTNTRNPYIISLDGKIVWEPPSDIYPLSGVAISWAPDSSRFVYTAFTENATQENFETQVVIGDVKNRRVYPLKLPRNAHFPHWSKDGKWIIFIARDEINGGVFLYAVQPDGRNLIKLGDSGSVWAIGQDAPDGRKFLLSEDIFSLNIDQHKPNPEADSERLYIVDMHDFSKELFFQGDSFGSLQWLPAISK